MEIEIRRHKIPLFLPDISTFVQSIEMNNGLLGCCAGYPLIYDVLMSVVN